MRRLLLACLCFALAGLAGCNPARSEHAVGENAESIAELRAADIDVGKPLPIDFYSSFPDQEHALRAVRALGRSGFDTQVGAGENDDFLVIASRTFVVSEPELDRIENEIVAIVDPEDGVYEGWDTDAL